MRKERQAERRREIQDAAVELLIEKGYASTSMLAVAKRAGASNETLYRWYGDKQGLFRAVVEANAERVTSALRSAIVEAQGPQAVLTAIGPMLLTVLTGERAIALNRAAAADASGQLGRAIAAAGRDAVAPLLADALRPTLGAAAADAVDAYFSLLIGDHQIRRVIGAAATLEASEIEDRARVAVDRMARLFPTLSA